MGRFEALGLPADKEIGPDGQVVVTSQVRFRDELVDISVHYPAETPELPPEIVGPPGLLDRHQHPVGGNFCLLETPDSWSSGGWGAADLIREQLDSLLRDTEAGAEVVATAELPVPEPHSAYYNYPGNSMVLMTSNLVTPVAEQGTMKLTLFAGLGMRCVVREVAGMRWDPSCKVSFQPGPNVTGRWKKLDEPPPVLGADELAAWVAKEHPDLLSAMRMKKLRGTTSSSTVAGDMVGLVFEEEAIDVGKRGWAWLFLYIPRGDAPLLLHHQVISVEERGRRLPQGDALATHSVLLLGAGTIGGPVALELARAGLGNLSIVDWDRYEVNNAVRHPLSVEYAGFQKAESLAHACRGANPYCVVTVVTARLGRTDWSGVSSAQMLHDLISSVDAVVEATGSHQVQRYVGRICDELDKPLIAAWLTDEFLGGHVLRVIPGVTRSFLCIATELSDGEGLQAISGDAPPRFPQGCAQPTTVGAGFDSAEIAAIATRLTVQTLLGQEFRESGWDHCVVNFYEHEDGLQTSRFRAIASPIHEGCRYCRTDAG